MVGVPPATASAPQVRGPAPRGWLVRARIGGEPWFTSFFASRHRSSGRHLRWSGCHRHDPLAPDPVVLPDCVLGPGDLCAAWAIPLRPPPHPAPPPASRSSIRPSRFRRWLAEEEVLDDLRWRLLWPDALRHEERLQEEWRNARPLAHALATKSAETALPTFAAASLPSAASRIHLRLAAARRVAAIAEGAVELFAGSPTLGGDPWVEVPCPWSPQRSLRIGEQTASFLPPGDEQPQPPIPDGTLVAVERALLGGDPSPDPAGWATLAATASELAGIRSWDATSCIPALGDGCRHPARPPRGLEPRPSVAALCVGPAAAAWRSWLERQGSGAWVAPPVAAWLAGRSAEILARAADPDLPGRRRRARSFPRPCDMPDSRATGERAGEAASLPRP